MTFANHCSISARLSEGTGGLRPESCLGPFFITQLPCSTSVAGAGPIGKRSEVALHLPVPLEARDRTLPPAPHILQRRGVGGVACGDGVLEVLILGMDDLVGVVAAVLEIACTAKLPARHGF